MSSTSSSLDEILEHALVRMAGYEDMHELYAEDNGDADSYHEMRSVLDRIWEHRDKATAAIQAEITKARIEGRNESFLSKLAELPVTDQPLLLGGLLYQYLMQPTYADKFTVTLDNFSYKGKDLGDLQITAELKPTGGNDEPLAAGEPK